MTTVKDLAGVWRRSLIRWPDGRSDATTVVRWMQTPSLFVDLRQPADRPSFAQVRCLRDLDRAQVEWLASQEGFAGVTLFDGRLCEWQRQIDFQPLAALPDAGHLRFEGTTLIEEGRDLPYVEHWHREFETPDPCAGLGLRDAATGAPGMLVRVGASFMIARSRTAALPPQRRLDELVSGVAALHAAQDLVDCEISFGVIGVDGWRILHSSLPFKEGQDLTPRAAAAAGGVRTLDLTPAGSRIERHWQVTQVEGNAEVLLSPPQQHARAVDGQTHQQEQRQDGG